MCMQLIYSERFGSLARLAPATQISNIDQIQFSQEQNLLYPVGIYSLAHYGHIGKSLVDFDNIVSIGVVLPCFECHGLQQLVEQGWKQSRWKLKFHQAQIRARVGIHVLVCCWISEDPIFHLNTGPERLWFTGKRGSTELRGIGASLVQAATLRPGSRMEIMDSSWLDENLLLSKVRLAVVAEWFITHAYLPVFKIWRPFLRT